MDLLCVHLFDALGNRKDIGFAIPPGLIAQEEVTRYRNVLLEFSKHLSAKFGLVSHLCLDVKEGDDYARHHKE